MSGKMFKGLLAVVAGFLVLGCATQKPVTIQAQNLNPKLSSSQLVPKVDNFIMILDGSASMANPYNRVEKSDLEKNLASVLNQTIPDIRLNAGLRSFGDISSKSGQQTALYYGMTQYTKSGLEGAIAKVKTSGNSPLELAISGASDDLKGTTGKSAVIIFSDGEDMTDAPIRAAKGMKALYGDRICIYTVQIGNKPAGKSLLEKVAREGGCGFFTTGDSLASSSGMADFVEKVFLMPKPVVASKPQPLPAKPMKEKKVVKSAPAEAVAQEIFEKGRATINVEFDTNKANIKPKYRGEIKKFADVMKNYPDLKIVIEGHTDNVGGKAYNEKLSQRRAESVKRYMVEKFGIDASRLTAKGYGMSKPIASNKTAAGRQKNRRVEAAMDYQIKK